jgi:hypothetical protein
MKPKSGRLGGITGRGGIMERDPAWLKPGPLGGPPQSQLSRG